MAVVPEELISAKADSLKGLTVLGKIELPADRTKKKGGPVASSDERGKDKNVLENVLIASQARQILQAQAKHQVHQIVLRNKEVEDLDSHLDLDSHVPQEEPRSSVFRRRNQRLKKFKIKSSKPSLGFKAISQVEKLNQDVTSVPSATVR